jgi:hypothetical protein
MQALRGEGVPRGVKRQPLDAQLGARAVPRGPIEAHQSDVPSLVPHAVPDERLHREQPRPSQPADSRSISQSLPRLAASRGRRRDRRVHRCGGGRGASIYRSSEDSERMTGRIAFAVFFCARCAAVATRLSDMLGRRPARRTGTRRFRVGRFFFAASPRHSVRAFQAFSILKPALKAAFRAARSAASTSRTHRSASSAAFFVMMHAPVTGMNMHPRWAAWATFCTVRDRSIVSPMACHSFIAFSYFRTASS